MDKDFFISPEEKERLYNLLKYANEAMEYWFDGCDVSEENTVENMNQRKECEYFINKLKEE
jgi:hypothetical protein